MLIFFLYLASQIAVSTVLITITAMLGKSGIAGGWAAMQVYSAELFPTVARLEQLHYFMQLLFIAMMCNVHMSIL